MGKSLIAKFQKELLELRLTYLALDLWAPIAFAVSTKVSRKIADCNRGINRVEIKNKAGIMAKIGIKDKVEQAIASIHKNATNTVVRLPFPAQNQAIPTSNQLPSHTPQSPAGKAIHPIIL